MSLQVWLPLNGNLNNQGLMEVTTSNTPVYASGGKFGKCLSNQIAISGYGDALQPSHTRSVSISCWFKCTTSDYLIACNAWEFRCSPSLVQFRLGNGGTNTYSATSPNKAKADVWNHIAGTWDSENKIVKVYLNGNLEASSQVSSDIDFNPISSTFTLPYNGTSTYVNDLRMYNHCLSAKEVKEISKGLICHYKLDNNGFGNPNLITTMAVGGGVSLNGKYGLNANFSQATTDTYGWIYVDPPLELDSTYTLSFDVSNFPTGGAWSFALWNSFNYDIGTITKDGHYVYTFVPSESKLPSGYSLTTFLFDDKVRDNPIGTEWVYFTNFKIEKGSVATPWCPHTSDSLYASLGLDSATESDCSGYGCNGTISGSGDYESNSPRFLSSFTTNSTGKISSPNGFPVGTHPVFTVNFWLKSNEGTFSQWRDVFSIQGNHQIRLETVNTSGSAFKWFNYPLGTARGFGEFVVSKNVWYMITLVSDGSKFYCYKDASLYDTTTITGTEWTTTGATTIGDSSGVYVSISDVRIYSTALSTSDIKELYNTSASIDKSGNMYAYEFKEE